MRTLPQIMGNNDLTNEHKVSARSLAEIARDLNASLTLLQNAGYKFRGRKITSEAVLNAIYLEWLAMSDPQREAVIARRVPELEKAMGLPLSRQPEMILKPDDPQAAVAGPKVRKAKA